MRKTSFKSKALWGAAGAGIVVIAISFGIAFQARHAALALKEAQTAKEVAVSAKQNAGDGIRNGK